MRQIQDANQRLCESRRSRPFTLLVISAVLLCFLSASAFASTKPGVHKPIQKAKHKPAPAVIAEVPAEAPTPPEPPPPPPRPEQLPPVPPEVSWDGKLLTIHAENSTLLDVLNLVRQRTGASVDIPPSAGSERVVLDIGPSPVREALTSLLYGTEFDYIIQSSETNDDAIRSVVITQRGKEDESTTIVSSAGTPGGAVRRMPGYSGSGKPTFETEYAPEKQAKKAEADAESAAPTGSGSESGDAESASTDAPADKDKQDAQAVAAPASSEAAAAADSSAATSASVSAPVSGSDSNANQAPAMPQMIEDMQRLFQQRRQIQSQQNQAAQSGAN